MSRIEDKIDSMFGLSDQGGSDSISSGDAGEDQNTPAGGEQDANAPDANEAQTEGQRDDSNSKGNNDQPSTQHTQQRQGAQGGQQGQQRLPANQRGDLIDPTTGQVVARAGNERRYFEAARNAQNEIRRVQSEMSRLQEQISMYREVNQMPQQLGLQPRETAVAMQFMAHWKRDPVGAAAKVLTELRAMGYDVEGLAPTVDVNAIRQVVTDAVSPFQRDREIAQREAEVAANVQRELNDLFTEFDWAEGQQDAIRNLLEVRPTLTLREAALMLQNHALQHGYDLYQPLREQVLRQQQNGNGGATEPRVVNQQQRMRQNNAMMPAPGNNGAVPNAQRRPAAVGHDRSNRDIVRESMREAGFNVDNI